MLACASLVRLKPRSRSDAGRGPLLASVIVDEGKGCCYREADAPDEEKGPNRVEISGNVKDQRPLFRTLLPARRKSQISPAFPHSRPVRQVRHCRNSSREPLKNSR